ncbi:hypothetical protein OCGS_0846 [Oceaniovalibus guishaninsula JLT2003]|uniref:Uncharacterized protein n=1 Tax=Oceaniovalibus guishaninsula JLT2003 TaxID=1231392 RepID=K2GRG0_9RHOB|nr:hypothetical protein [Oceaniovalibus guishaninsula]EKE45151.1 hypothetical protein OCGS_0846 [Oceaniovalibus guishaninsula JLT2003]
MRRRIATAALLALALPCAAWAQQGDDGPESAKALAERGFVPFGVSPAGGAVFGMIDGSDIRLCFFADGEDGGQWRGQVERFRHGGGGSVPTIGLVCIPTQ